MKKLIAILLTALMLAGIFTGCKAKKEENKMLRVAALSSGYEATKVERGLRCFYKPNRN